MRLPPEQFPGAVALRHDPRRIAGPDISLATGALPWYAGLSLARMAAAYALSLAFTLACGSLAHGSSDKLRDIRLTLRLISTNDAIDASTSTVPIAAPIPDASR